MSHGIVMVSDSIPVADFNATLALFRDAATTMFVRLISRGKVKPSSQTLFRKKSKKKSRKQRTRGGGKPQRPLACPRTGLVKNATDDMTGRAHLHVLNQSKLPL